MSKLKIYCSKKCKKKKCTKKVQITREETSKKTIDYLDIYQIKNMIGMIINKDIRYTLTIVLNLIFVCNSLFKNLPHSTI